MTGVMLWLATIVMEVSWIGAAAAFILAAWVERAWPVPEALACCMLASALTSVTARRGWRGIQIVAVHALGFACFVLRDVHLAWAADEPFWSFAWLARLAGAGTAAAPLAFSLLALATLALWWSGVLHGLRPTTHRNVCARFDLGMYWLFGVLLVRLVWRGQPGVPSADPIADALVPSFFVFGICAIAIARNRGGGAKSLTRGSRGVGVVLGLGATALVCTAFATLLVLPYLTALSRRGHAGIATAAMPLANRAAQLVVAAIHLLLERPVPLYTPGRIVTVGSVGAAVAEQVFKDTPFEVLTESDPRSLWIVLGVASACALGAAAWLKRRWLFSRTARAERPPSRLWLLLRRVWQYVQRASTLWQRLVASRELGPVRLYAALAKWGARTGLPRAGHETPLEYGERLKRQLARPSTDADIDLIVATFNLHVYAEPVRDRQALARARSALRRLRSPRLWLRRFVIWLRSSTLPSRSPGLQA